MARRSGWSNAAYVTVQAVITTAANELVTMPQAILFGAAVTAS